MPFFVVTLSVSMVVVLDFAPVVLVVILFVVVKVETVGVIAALPVCTLFWTIEINHLKMTYSLHVKNISLTESAKVLLNLYISTLFVLKLTLMLTVFL